MAGTGTGTAPALAAGTSGTASPTVDDLTRVVVPAASRTGRPAALVTLAGCDW
ncbi:MAG: hypothetical protein ACRDTU_19420 [Micromonosporaceae bacterium]